MARSLVEPVMMHEQDCQNASGAISLCAPRSIWRQHKPNAHVKKGYFPIRSAIARW